MADEKPTSRRDFLRGRAMLARMQSLADRALGPVEGGAAPAGRPPAVAQAAKLHATRRAMACEFSIQYHAADGAAAGDGALAALDLIDELEAQLTIFRETSEIIEINRTAAVAPIEVELRLFSLLELCAWLHAETRGAFDLTSGPLSRLWGFLRREGRLPAEADIAEALAAVGGERIALDRTARTIAFADPRLEINLNAVGKGYALDRATELLADRGVDDFLIEGGGSSVSARGRDRGDGARGWRIGVPHPHERQRHIGEIILRDEALGTSGAGTQFFVADGRRYGHLIDPRTGWPAEGVFTASVIASTAAEADALSTALYILGAGGAAEYCATHPDIGAVLVCPRGGGADDAFDVHAFNLNSDRWRPA